MKICYTVLLTADGISCVISKPHTNGSQSLSYFVSIIYILLHFQTQDKN